MRLLYRAPIISEVYTFFINYPAPLNLSYAWNFGVYAFFCLIFQIVTGVLLGMHYVPDPAYAFLSVEYVMRDLKWGWLLRYLHANGASVFFIAIYLHMLRGIYYGSYFYPRDLVWCTGVLIMLMMILTAFLGYVLPWGQMSFWGATVITNFVSAVPFVGNDLVVWLWGGFAVGGATLNRFFALHFFFPVLSISLILWHFNALHDVGSNNPTGIEFKFVDHLYFYPYYIVKDLYGLIFFILSFFFFVFFSPNVLGHTDNYILANSLSTPSHIVPEWYFLPFYAILRAIPDKLGGVLTMLASILVLFFIPFFLFPSVKLTTFRPFSMITFCFLCVCLFFLGWLGSRPAEVPYIFMGQLATFFYFFYWFILLPVAFWLELCLWDNAWFLVLFRMAGAGMFFGDLYLFYKRLPLDVDRIILNNGRHNIPYLHSERE